MRATINTLAEAGRRGIVTIRGGSMRPLLADGCRVVIETRPKGIRMGDIVVFSLEGALTVHRVVRVKTGPTGFLFQTKGDSSLCPDSASIDASDVLARVIAIRRPNADVDLRTDAWNRSDRLIALNSYRTGLVGSAARSCVGWLLRDRQSSFVRVAAGAISSILRVFPWLVQAVTSTDFSPRSHTSSGEASAVGSDPLNRGREERMLCWCARARLDDGAVGSTRDLVRNGMDWDRFLACCAGHGVTPLVFHNLQRHQVLEDVPAETMRQLEQAYYATMRRNLRICDGLEELLRAFRGVGIEAICLKGAALAEFAYGNLAVRPFGDVDLLVKETDIHAIGAALSTLGYEPARRRPMLSPAHALQHAHYRGQWRYHRKNTALVELHFRLVNIGVPAAEEAVWENTRQMRLGDIEILMPSVEDTLFHLCIHANQHGYCMLRLFSDIDAVVGRYGRVLDWERFMDLVTQRSLQASVYHTLGYTRLLLDTDLPEMVMARLQPGRLRSRLFSCLWGEKRILQLRAVRKPESAEAPFFYILEMDGLREKTAYVFRVASLRARAGLRNR
ncbi:signal peptidase I [Candidatus Eisenbacteria bacterium]|uniref:Signal peptidase I n=1 Tax=Eiseniibacteriota bacterium TaxID=2212470 RepID=A0ABV6YJA7_UNCEI